jgi:hypothetical protein
MAHMEDIKSELSPYCRQFTGSIACNKDPMLILHVPETLIISITYVRDPKCKKCRLFDHNDQNMSKFCADTFFVSLSKRPKNSSHCTDNLACCVSLRDTGRDFYG